MQKASVALCVSALCANAVSAGFLDAVVVGRAAAPYYGDRADTDAQLCSSIDWGFDGYYGSATTGSGSSGSGDASSDAYAGLPGACWSPTADCSNTGESFSCWEGMTGSNGGMSGSGSSSGGNWWSGSMSGFFGLARSPFQMAAPLAAPVEERANLGAFVNEMWDSDSWGWGSGSGSGSGSSGCLCGNWLDFDFSVDQGSLAIDEAPGQGQSEIDFEARSTVVRVSDNQAIIESESEQNSNHLHYVFGDLERNGAVGVSVAYTGASSAEKEFIIVYERAIEYVEKNGMDGFQRADVTVGAHQFMASDFIFRQVYPSFKTQNDFGADLKFFEGTDGTLTTATAVTAGAKTQQYLMNGRLGCPHNTKSDFILDYMPQNDQSMFALQVAVYSNSPISQSERSGVTGSGNPGGIIETDLAGDATGYFGYVLEGYVDGNQGKIVDVITEEWPCTTSWNDFDYCSSYVFSFNGMHASNKVTWDPEIGVYGGAVDWSSANTVAASMVSVAAVVAAALLF